MRHSANLDILRSFAVSAVLIDHLVPTIQAHAGFNNHAIIAFTAQIGHAGVLAFFVHTSLVLMYSLERIHEKFNAVTSCFYIRRFFRIYPLTIFSIALALLLHIPSSTWSAPFHITPAITLANVLLVQNIFTKKDVLVPLWSLPYEVQMYLVLPAIFLLARRLKGVYWIAFLIVLSCLAGLLLGYKTGHLNLAAYVPCFLSGVLCYSLRDRIRQTIPAALWSPFLILIISIFCLNNIDSGRTWLTKTPTFWSGWIFSLVLSLAISNFRDSRAALPNFVAKKTALYSYGIYLLHVPVMYLIFIRLNIQNLYFSVPLFVFLTVAASIATFHTIESPFIQLGLRLSSGGLLLKAVPHPEVQPAVSVP